MTMTMVTDDVDDIDNNGESGPKYDDTITNPGKKLQALVNPYWLSHHECPHPTSQVVFHVICKAE